MLWEYVICGVVVIALLAYLTYAIVNPQKF